MQKISHYAAFGNLARFSIDWSAGLLLFRGDSVLRFIRGLRMNFEGLWTPFSDSPPIMGTNRSSGSLFSFASKSRFRKKEPSRGAFLSRVPSRKCWRLRLLLSFNRRSNRSIESNSLQLGILSGERWLVRMDLVNLWLMHISSMGVMGLWCFGVDRVVVLVFCSLLLSNRKVSLMLNGSIVDDKWRIPISLWNTSVSSLLLRGRIGSWAVLEDSGRLPSIISSRAMQKLALRSRTLGIL